MKTIIVKDVGQALFAMANKYETLLAALLFMACMSFGMSTLDGFQIIDAHVAKRVLNHGDFL